MRDLSDIQDFGSFVRAGKETKFLRAIPVKNARSSAAAGVRNARRVTGLIGAIDRRKVVVKSQRRAALTPDHYPGKSVVAFEAMPVNSLEWGVRPGSVRTVPR
jgi:hypothetical protein